MISSKLENLLSKFVCYRHKGNDDNIKVVIMTLVILLDASKFVMYNACYVIKWEKFVKLIVTRWRPAFFMLYY